MIENHVPSFETCKRLKEAGFPQGIIFSFDPSDEKQWFFGVPPKGCIGIPILSEILCSLPDLKWQLFTVMDYWVVEMGGHRLAHTNPAEAAALEWLELKEKK